MYGLLLSECCVLVFATTLMEVILRAPAHPCLCPSNGALRVRGILVM